MTRFADLLQRFRKDERGVFAVMFGLMAIVLIATSGAVVDFTSMEQARTRAQTALDSAALALQGKIDDLTEDELKAQAQAILEERLDDNNITAVVDSADEDTNAGTLNLQAHIVVPTFFVQLVGISSIEAGLESEVTRASSDIEVSLALDVTGSMAGTKIEDLIEATKELIELLVSDTQTPTYSKMAIVPWSVAVNVGSSYADSVRGAATPGVKISTATWMSGTSKTISGVTKANPAVVTTSAAHGFTAGDYIYITNVNGMTNLNNNIYKVGTVTSTTKFRLLTTSGSNVNSSSWSAFTTSSSSKVTKCLNSSCQVLVTTSGTHGLSAGNTVYITGASGTMNLNGTHASAVGTVPTTSSYYLTDRDSDAVLYTSYTANSGTSYCTLYGCTYYYFNNAAGGYTLYKINTCATDRTTNTYTDAAPSTTPLGKNYRSNGSDCLEQEIVPLTSNKATLNALVGDLEATGSTAGHIGLAWGWYMLAPNFAYLWPTDSQPAAYDEDNLVKVVIFMTDGDFNTPYCNGVVAKDAGNDSSYNSCTSPNGSSKSQAEKLCDAIKAPANDTLLYTIGFDLAGNSSALTMLKNCATSPDQFFQADDGTDLKVAFQDIADQLSDLHISK